LYLLFPFRSLPPLSLYSLSPSSLEKSVLFSKNARPRALGARRSGNYQRALLAAATGAAGSPGPLLGTTATLMSHHPVHRLITAGDIQIIVAATNRLN